MINESQNCAFIATVSVRSKTGCSNRTKLAVWALRNGLGGDPTGA